MNIRFNELSVWISDIDIKCGKKMFDHMYLYDRIIIQTPKFRLHIVFYLRFCNKTNDCEETKYAMQISHRYFP